MARFRDVPDALLQIDPLRVDAPAVEIRNGRNIGRKIRVGRVLARWRIVACLSLQLLL